MSTTMHIDLARGMNDQSFLSFVTYERWCQEDAVFGKTELPTSKGR